MKPWFYKSCIPGISKSWDKFWLLIWKNWLLQWRKPIQTFIEIVSPVLFSIFLVAIRSLVDPTDNETLIFQPFCPTEPASNMSSSSICDLKLTQNSSLRLKSDIRNYAVLFTPKNELTRRIMDMATIANLAVLGFDTSEELVQFYRTHAARTFVAFEFGEIHKGADVTVTIRFPSELRIISMNKTLIGTATDWGTNLLYPIFQMRGPRNPNSSHGGDPDYADELFLSLQQLITISVINLKTNKDDFLNRIPYIHVRRFPFYKWTEDPILEALEGFSGMVVMLSFTYTCMNLVRMITNEKEKQLKELMKIMGLSNGLQWLAWFVKSFSFLFISTLLITVLLKVKWYSKSDFSVFTNTDPSIIITFFLLYISSVITFCFAISVFFSKANNAAAVSSVVWFLAYVPFLSLRGKYFLLSLNEKLAACIGMNSAMALGFQTILMFEGLREGSQWYNISKPGSPDDTLTLGMVFMMLIFDTFLYLCIALYVEAINPGGYGLPQPWYFPFTKTFWFKNTSKRVTFSNNIIVPENLISFTEHEPKNLNAGIKIRHLRKEFKGNAVVDGLSLNMYENQITVLLGHNGAGKTTTMSMLTGMFPPTSGTAIMNGFDIRTDMDSVRSSLGLCPQHNILFDEMTVNEHLYFYSKLKGKRGDELKEEIKKYVELLELVPKANSKSKTLSGGMKRKLCVGIALCGDSKIVILDEPTAGMDPSARRALWELIQREKEGRTMMLTTHFMDEADLLGDRIAIMARGRLKCSGSSFFLKKKFGAGYNLIMEKSSTCDPKNVENFLKKYIPDIEIHTNVGSELTFILPEDKVSIFQNMFGDFEKNYKSLGVNNFGVSLTTLEDVFMKVGADHEPGENDSPPNFPQNQKTGTNNEANQFLTGFSLVKNQYSAMIMKKFLSTLRSWRLLLIIFCFPIINLVIVMILKKILRTAELPPLKLDIDSYKRQKPIILIESDDVNNKYEMRFKKLTNAATYKDVSNLTREMLKLTETNPSGVRTHYLTGASFESGKNSEKPILTAWFNNDALHTAPVSLGMILNSIYQNEVQDNSRINFINHPLPFKLSSQFARLGDSESLGFKIAFNLGFSMTFVAAYFIMFNIKERVIKSKHLQFVSGVKVIIFWTTSFFCDFLVFVVIIFCTLVTLACFREEGARNFDELSRIFLILSMFAYSAIPIMYVMSNFLLVPSTGHTRMSLFGILTGNMLFLITTLMKIPQLELIDVANTLHWIFLIIPHYAMCTGILNNYNIFAFSKYCTKFVDACQRVNSTEYCSKQVCIIFPDFCCKTYFQWHQPGLLPNILYMFGVGTVIFALILMTDYKMFNMMIEKIKGIKQKFPVDVPNEDDDVTAEKMKIRSTNETDLKNEYSMVMKDLTKYYGNFLAVNGLCLGIKEYECFGLLGINGAGKTSTFMMLTGDTKMTYGKAWVHGLSINNQLKLVQKQIGYCPQFDALLDDLTARESLKMFCLLRGIRRSDCESIAQKLSYDFDFTRHLDKKVRELSGGNKRKLSTAISLIGDPPVLYLDEPTTGMDPATKRFLWNALCTLRDNGKCIVLTSHSMEECEALCTKIAIMVNGNFKCLGSTQHLKSKFAEGYTLIIKVKKIDTSESKERLNTESIKEFVEKNFKKAQLREEHQELLTYYILDKSMTWSTMFGILEGGKKKLDIEDYSLGQSSLEQVFLTFTKFQQNEEI